MLFINRKWCMCRCNGVQNKKQPHTPANRKTLWNGSLSLWLAPNVCYIASNTFHLSLLRWKIRARELKYTESSVYRWNKSEMSTIMKTNDGCVFLCFDTPNEQIDIYSAIEIGTNPRLGSALQLYTMSGSIGNDKWAFWCLCYFIWHVSRQRRW